MAYGGAANFKLYEVTKYITETNVGFGPFFILMNTAKFNSLPADVQQQMMSVLGPDWTLWASRYTDNSNIKSKQLCKDKGVEIITLSAEDRAKMVTLAKPLWDDHIANMESKGLPGKTTLAEILKFISAYKPPK
jgi:C4-dicarboxylate-binding protein DctP